MTSLCKKESICAVHEKQTQAKQLSVKQHVRQHGARLQVTDSDGITMRKRVAHSLQPHQEARCTAPMGLQFRTTNHSPCTLELSRDFPHEHLRQTTSTMPCSLHSVQWVVLPPGIPKEGRDFPHEHLRLVTLAMPCSLHSLQWVARPPGIPKEA